MRIACPIFSNLLALCMLATALSSTVQAQGEEYHFKVITESGRAYCASDSDCIMALIRAAHMAETAEPDRFDPKNFIACPHRIFGKSTYCRQIRCCNRYFPHPEGCDCPAESYVPDPESDYTYQIIYCCDGDIECEVGMGGTPEAAALNAYDNIPDCGDPFYLISGAPGPIFPECPDDKCDALLCCSASCNKSCTPQRCCKPRSSRRGGLLRRLFRR